MKSVFTGIAGKFAFYGLFLIPLVLILEIPVFLAGAGLGALVVFSKDLPEIPEMASYQPRTVSTFYSDDGTVIGIFYKQKRFVVELEQIPQHVIDAFLAAEDARYFEHNGIDWIRIAGAALRNIKAGRITQGGSTITMQVTRNFMLSRERRASRKIKEVVLAGKLEKAWGKEKILHVYLNEIYLGEGCYGIEAAARGYFDKPVEHLSVSEAALLAGLVAGPARFNPFKSEELARQKQVTVLQRMEKAGFINHDQYEAAKNHSLQFRKEQVRPFDIVPDFSEAVRRYVIKKYGEDKLYNEGLKVFTTVRIDYQKHAAESMEKGLEEIKKRQKTPAILNTVPQAEIKEILQKRSISDLQEGKLYEGVVTKAYKKGKDFVMEVGLSKAVNGQVYIDLALAPHFKVGNVLALRFMKFSQDTPIFELDNDAKLQGALVSIENRTGYVRALIGGASSDHFQFNRATQAKRQPGSSFKPFIYATALEQKSYTPATLIVDEPIIVDLDSDEVEWEPRNSGGDFMGPLTFRRALELSRNICTIKILMDVGFDPVIQIARKMGVTSDLGRNLSLSLGTSELSLFEMTSAYTVFPNSGVHLDPVLVKRIEDRFGHVLEDNSDIPLLDESQIPKPTPREEFSDEIKSVPPTKKTVQDKLKPGPTKQKNAVDESSSDALHKRQVKAALSPQTAYVMTSLLQGGVRQGTGARVANYVKRKDLAGKTGTTNRAADTWFIGFNPEFTTGVWVGYDEKRPLGGREEGSRAALPIWGYYMKEVLQNKPERDFPVPPEITFKDMATFVGTPSTGYSAKTVREPVYTPFVGKTLELSPLDTPQTLAQYRGIVIPYVQQDNSAQYQTPVAVPATPVGTGPTPQQVVPAAPTYGPGISPDRHSYTTHPAAIPASAKTKSNLVPIQSINDPVTPKSPSGKEVSENTAVRKSRPNNPKDPTPKTPMPKARP